MEKIRGVVAFILAVVCCTPPAFPAVTIPPLTTYGNLPGFESAAVSSSGDRVAVIGIAQDQRRLVVMDKDGKPLAVAPIGDAKVRRLLWAGDNLVLVETSNTTGLGVGFLADKAELFSMLVVPLDGGNPWRVFASARMITGGVRRFYGLTESEGHWFGYFSGIALDGGGTTTPYLQTTSPNLYQVDLQTQRTVKIAARMEGEGERDWIVGADGTVSATLDYFSTSGKWSLVNGSRRTLASGVNRFGRVGLIGFGPTPGTILYFEEGDRDHQRRWLEVPVAGGPPKETLSGVAVGESLFDTRTRQLFGYGVDGDTPSYKLLDAHRQKVITATQKAFPNASVHLVDWNDSFDRLIVMTEGAGDSQSWWFVDIRTGDARPLGNAYPMPANAVAPMKMIDYLAGDGTRISAVLTVPPGRPAMNLPAIVLPHGGPAARDYPGFDWWAQAFATRGYVVLQPNFRGSTGYGTAFERAGHGEWGRKMQTDISDGLARLVRDGTVDARRVCIVGASYGGYAALAGVTLQHGLYRCAVSLAGISDVNQMATTDIYESGSDPAIRRSLEEEVGPGRDLKAVSPIRFVDKVEVPILLIHGKDDTVVRYAQSSAMADALRKAGKTVEFVTLPGEDHWLSKSATRLKMLQAAVAFVEKYNPADTAK
jgi:dienelactone hydrolase